MEQPKEITFAAAFPKGRFAVSTKPGEACKITLDAYLDPPEIALLVDISNADASLMVTIRVEDDEVYGAGAA